MKQEVFRNGGSKGLSEGNLWGPGQAAEGPESRVKQVGGFGGGGVWRAE